jgi:hypothetical protein
VSEAYAPRQATVSAHQEPIRLHLGFRALGLVEREALRGYPETFSHRHREITQHPCGHETQRDCREQVCSA